MDFDELRGRTVLFHAAVLSRAVKTSDVLSELVACVVERDVVPAAMQPDSAPAPAFAPARDSASSFLADSTIYDCAVAEIPDAVWQALAGGKGAALFVQSSPSEAMVIVHGDALPPSVLAACKDGALDVAREVVARCCWNSCPHAEAIVTIGRLTADVSL